MHVRRVDNQAQENYYIHQLKHLKSVFLEAACNVSQIDGRLITLKHGVTTAQCEVVKQRCARNCAGL